MSAFGSSIVPICSAATSSGTDVLAPVRSSRSSTIRAQNSTSMQKETPDSGLQASGAKLIRLSTPQICVVASDPVLSSWREDIECDGVRQRRYSVRDIRRDLQRLTGFHQDFTVIELE